MAVGGAGVAGRFRRSSREQLIPLHNSVAQAFADESGVGRRLFRRLRAGQRRSERSQPPVSPFIDHREHRHPRARILAYGAAGVEARLSLPAWAFAGEEARGELDVANRSRFIPIPGLNFEGGSRRGRAQCAVPLLPPASSVRARLSIHPRAAGNRAAGGGRDLDDGAGGPRAAFEGLRGARDDVVYPSIAGVRVGPMPRSRRETGRAFASREGDFAGLREWRPGDSPRHIHWRSSARAGRLLTKEFVR